jgi:hypothetical protein
MSREEEEAVVKDMKRLRNKKAPDKETKARLSSRREEYPNATVIEAEQEAKGVKAEGLEDLDNINEDIRVSQLQGHQLIEDSFKKEINVDKQQEQDSEDSDNNERYKGASRELFSNKDVRVKTELNMKEILAVVKINTISDRYKIPLYKALSEDYMSLKISHLRKSRQEFIHGLHAEEKRERGVEEQGGGMIDAFLNKFKRSGN